MTASVTTVTDGFPPGEVPDEPFFPLPSESEVLETAAWGEVFDRRVLVLLSDVGESGIGDEVAASVDGTVVARFEGSPMVEIEISVSGEDAIASSLEVLGARADVLVAAPSSVVRSRQEVVERPCGPLDALVLESEGRGNHFRLIGVEDAWRLVRASGVAITPPTVGVVDGFGQSEHYHGSWVSEVIDASPGRDAPGVLDAILPDGEFSLQKVEVFGSSPITSAPNALAGAEHLIRNGATVINMSLGVDNAPPATIALWRTTIRDLARRYPDVVIVAAAGNQAADVSTEVPGALTEPNLVIVGGLNHQGDPWTDKWTDKHGVEHTEGSNFVGGGGGEVTLAALAQDVFTGMSADGRPVTKTGNSFATPQVSAAAALLKALDPTLTGAEIKQILVESAATQISDAVFSDRIKDVDPGVGGRVLRVDNALWKVLSERLGVTDAREALLGRATLNADARQLGGDPLDYRIIAIAPGGGNSTTVQIATNGPGGLVPGAGELTTSENRARWRWTFFDYGESVQVTLTRNDTGACARLVITAQEPGPVFAGSYEGSFGWTIPDAGLAEDVPFSATVTAEGRITGAFEWSGVYDYGGGSGVQAQMWIEGSCQGTVDPDGGFLCRGEFVGTSEVLGVEYADRGEFTVEGVIEPDGTMTGVVGVTNDSGHEGQFDLTGRRVSD